jgi:hypothetical protein
MTSAQNTRAVIRDALEADLSALKGRVVDVLARCPEPQDQVCVIFADCGMVLSAFAGRVQLEGIGTGVGLWTPRRPEAVRVADAWNAKLTAEQSAAKCWVKVLPLSEALERAIEDKEALLEKLAAA